MNASGLINDANLLHLLSMLFDNQSFERHHLNYTEPFISWQTIYTLREVIWYVTLTLGIPGNILSAIVWLRDKNSSAVYLAVLAINDLIFLISDSLYQYRNVECFLGRWFCDCCQYLVWSAAYLEPLLVLGFSAERLIAILCPLKVCSWTVYIANSR